MAKRCASEIHNEVCEKGFDPGRNTFTQYYGSNELDASVLMIPLVGFLPAERPPGGRDGRGHRARAHGRRVRRPLRLATTEHVDGLTGREGAFLACSFWMVDDLHLIGRHDDAVELFERLLSLRNDLGLLSEEYDPVQKRLVGNFPQAFSHVSLVNSTVGLLGKAEGFTHEHRIARVAPKTHHLSALRPSRRRRRPAMGA